MRHYPRSETPLNRSATSEHRSIQRTDYLKKRGKPRAAVVQVVNPMTLKELVKDKRARFKFYKDGELWYETEDGFDFPIPIADTGTGVFKAEDTAIRYMRWIRKKG